MSGRLPLSEADINTLKRADQLWRRNKNQAERPSNELYRTVPLMEDEAVQTVIQLVQERLHGDGYRREFQLFQSLSDIPGWVQKFLSHDVSRVRIQEVTALSGNDLSRISKQLNKHHEWQP